MNVNVDRLDALKRDLEGITREHADILTLEPVIARPLYQAQDEARRRFNQISEGRGNEEHQTAP